MLTVGSSGSAVKKVQEALNKKTILPPGEKLLVTDGKFGNLTASRVRLYQIQNGLKVTGIVDNATGVKLGLFPDELKSDPVVLAPVVAPASLPSSSGFSFPEFFQQNKKSILLAAGGLGVVLVLSLFFRNKEQPVAIKSNPGKASKKRKKSGSRKKRKKGKKSRGKKKI